MAANRRRKFRLPVLSRLTLAWFCATGLLVILGGVFVYALSSRDGPGRIALAVDDVEYLARRPNINETPPQQEEAMTGLRLGAPNLRTDNDSETLLAAEGEDTNDTLLYPEEFAGAPFVAEESRGDIVITINGGGPNAAPAVAASLTPLPQPIPDPDPALLRTTPLGKVPRIAPDGRSAMTAYARPFDNPQAASRIAIIVGGLGLNPGLTERAIDELPPEVSLAFAPYARNLEFWTKKAREAGHEVLIELPMEGYGGNTQALGAAALLSSRTPEENLQRLDWLMARFGGYFAATNYMGAKFSATPDALTPILKKLGEAGVAYVDDTGAARDAITRAGVASITVNRIIPSAPDDNARRAVRRELNALEKIAARDGAALGKTYAYAATLDEIVRWTETLGEKDLVPAPASSVLQARR